VADSSLPTHASSVSPSSGPPWILGLRGAPQEAPENTLAGLGRALSLGLDGLAYDVRACASGDLVLMADAFVDRTTDLCGLLEQISPLDLSRADAGAHFGARFSGERVPYLGEALSAAESSTQHLIFALEPRTLTTLAAEVHEHGRKLSVRVASENVETCREARDLGLSTLLIVSRADARARDLVRHERFTAIGSTPEGWRGSALDDWPCERVVLRCDTPRDVLDACRLPFNALVTSEPRRALALRRLAALAPRDLLAPPFEAEALEVGASTQLGSEGEWSGRWKPKVRLANPFDAPLEVEFELRVRRGAFECGPLPAPRQLAPREVFEFRIELAGGSWSPGADPLLVAKLSNASESLELDAPFERRRRATLRESVTRLALLRESPADPPASVTLRRHRGDLLAAIEAPGDLEHARLVVRLGERVALGGDGVRLRLPPDFDRERAGAPFSIGILGARRTPRGRRRVLRRWAGGLPDVAPSGAPGRLFP
jgi:hypothetical protein